MVSHVVLPGAYPLRRTCQPLPPRNLLDARKSGACDPGRRKAFVSDWPTKLPGGGTNGERAEPMTLVQEAMTIGAETIEPDATLLFAAERMKAVRVGMLTVHDERDGVLGVITDRDIVVRAIAEGAAPEATRVRDIMTAHMVWCYEDAELSKAVELMQRHGVRRLVVLDRQHRLAGILSIDDVARIEQSPAAGVLRQSSLPI
jgi:CBS domain-containing protein